VRVAQGKSLRSVSAATGIDVGYLSKIERGLSQPTIDTLLVLARHLRLAELERLLSPYSSGDEQ